MRPHVSQQVAQRREPLGAGLPRTRDLELLPTMQLQMVSEDLCISLFEGAPGTGEGQAVENPRLGDVVLSWDALQHLVNEGGDRGRAQRVGLVAAIAIAR